MLKQVQLILGDRLQFIPIERLWAIAGCQVWGYTDGHTIWVAEELPSEPHPRYPSKLYVVYHEVAHIAIHKELLSWLPQFKAYLPKVNANYMRALPNSHRETELLCDCWALWALDHPEQVLVRIKRI